MDERRPVRLYFAYGSNLNRAQMLAADAGRGDYRGRCPDCEGVAPHTLEGFRLAFVGERTGRWGRGGVATIVPDVGVRVYGALYRLSRADEALLDGFEGLDPRNPAAGSYHKLEDVCRYAGEPVFTYCATARLQPENHPNQRYLETIRRGYAQWGLPLSELAGIATYPAET